MVSDFCEQDAGDDGARQLFGHAAMAVVIQMQVVVGQIESVAALARKFLHSVKAVDQKYAMFPCDFGYRRDDFFVIVVFDKGFAVLRID